MPTTVRLADDTELSVIQNMARFYIYEFSRFMPLDYAMAADGLFYDEDYSRFWRDEDKYPYLISAAAELAGFALVKSTTDGYYLDQFFVLYKFQGKGVGGSAVCQVFDKHPGRWRVDSLRENPKSEAFWPRVIREYCNGEFSVSLKEPGQTHHIYEFSNAAT